MVLRSQRDSLGSSSQAPRGRTSGTRGDIDVPAVGQRSGAQGPDSKGRASRSGVWVCGATLTWLHGWAGGAGEGIASSNRTLLPTGEERGGWECGDGVSRTAILALLGPGEKGNCSYEVLGTTGPGASGGTEQKFSTRPSSGGRSGAIAISWRAGSRGSGSPVPGTPPTLALHRLGRGGGGPRRFPVASSMLRPLWRLLLWPSWSGGGGRRRAPSATSRRRGCSRRWGWRQQRTAGAGCDETPPSASVRRRTVGQSPPPLRRIGRPGRSGSPGSGACRTPSYPPRSATGGAPGPLMWTSSDPGPAPWLSSPLARGPSLCAVPATHLGQHHPRAAVSTPWPGGPAGGPWRAGRKRPVQQHRKPWPLERTRTYRPWAEGVDYPSRRQRPAGKAAWQWRARLGGPPPTPGPLRRRGWWGRRRH